MHWPIFPINNPIRYAVLILIIVESRAQRLFRVICLVRGIASVWTAGLWVSEGLHSRTQQNGPQTQSSRSLMPCCLLFFFPVPLNKPRPFLGKPTKAHWKCSFIFIFGVLKLLIRPLIQWGGSKENIPEKFSRAWCGGKRAGGFLFWLQLLLAGWPGTSHSLTASLFSSIKWVQQHLTQCPCENLMR